MVVSNPVLVTTVVVLGLLVQVRSAAVQIAPPSPSAQSVVPIVIPMELLASRPLIRAMVNGQGPFAFLVQPESATTQIDRKLAEALKLAPQPDISGTPAFAVDFGFGSSTMRGVPVDITDMGRVVPEFGPAARPRGVISLSVWKDRLVTIDYPGWRVVVEQGALPEPNGRDIFLLSPSRELVVPLAIGQRSIACRVDPFFPRGLLLPASDAAQLPQASAPRDMGSISRNGQLVALSEASLTVDAVLGSFKFKSPQVLFARTGDGAILGSEWLRGFSITYDLTHSRARLERQ
jgi:hypothetical protein